MSSLKRSTKRKRKIRLVKAYKKGYKDQLNGRSGKPYNDLFEEDLAQAYELGKKNAKTGTDRPSGI